MTTIKEKLLNMISGDKPESTISGKIDSCKCGVATKEQTKVLSEILNIKNMHEQFRRFSHFIADNFDDRPELKKAMQSNTICFGRVSSLMKCSFISEGMAFSDKGFVFYSSKFDLNGVGLVIDKDKTLNLTPWEFDKSTTKERYLLDIVANRIISIQQRTNSLPLFIFNCETLDNLAECIKKAALRLEADNGNQA
jgi:hypothetical protein